MMGELAALGSALCWSIGQLFVKKVLRNVDPIHASIFQLVQAGLISAFLMFVFALHGHVPSIDAHGLIYLLIGTITGMVLGRMALFSALRMSDVSTVAPLSSSAPLFSAFLSVLILGETVSFLVFLGALAVVGGDWLILVRRSRGFSHIGRGEALALMVAFLWGLSTVINIRGISATDPFLGNMMRFLIFLPGILLLKFKSFRKIAGNAGSVGYLGLSCLVDLIVAPALLFFGAQLIGASRAISLSFTYPLFTSLLATTFLKEKMNAQKLLGILLVVVGSAVIAST